MGIGASSLRGAADGTGQDVGRATLGARTTENDGVDAFQADIQDARRGGTGSTPPTTGTSLQTIPEERGDPVQDRVSAFDREIEQAYRRHGVSMRRPTTGPGRADGSSGLLPERTRPTGAPAVAGQAAGRPRTEAQSHIDTYTAVENEYRRDADATTTVDGRRVPVNSSLRARHNDLSASLQQMRGALNNDGTMRDAVQYDAGLTQAREAQRELRETQSAIVSQRQGAQQNDETHRISNATKWILGIGSVGTLGIAAGTGLVAWNNVREATHPGSTGGGTTTENNDGTNTINNNSTTNGTSNSTTNNTGGTNGNSTTTNNGTVNATSNGNTTGNTSNTTNGTVNQT